VPESTGVPTLGDVLLWLAEQGALARACRLSEEEWNPKVLDRIREVTKRVGEAPVELREVARVDATDFIEFVLTSDEVSDELACVNNQLRMALDHLIGNYGFPIGEAFDAPLHPQADIQYICREDLEIDPPAWALDYFQPWPDFPGAYGTVIVDEAPEQRFGWPDTGNCPS